MRLASKLTLALVAALLGIAVLAATALGHATLLESKPKAGQVLERSPRAVVLVFDEAIDPEFVRLQVEDRAGRRVDRGEPYHPGGREERLAVRLAPGLEGAYAASYRVISEDGHPVVKRTAFRVRPPMRQRDDEGMPPAAGAAPTGPAMRDRGGEHEELDIGAVTDAAFAVARGLGYLAIALAVGGVVFLFAAWLPALAHVAGGGRAWLAASERFARLVRMIVMGAVLLGLAATAGAIVLQAATATGTSFWAALDADAVDAVSDTRPVQAWGARLGLWFLLGVSLLVVLRPRRMPGLRRAALGAEGAAPGPALSRAQALLLGGTIVALSLTAPMAGHSATYSPSGLLVLTDTVHVLAVSAWLGGLAMLLVALPVAVRALDREERMPLVAAAVGRFSRLAMGAVALLLLSGIVQSVALVGAFDAFVETAYGRLVLAKIVLFVGLISLGAYNQRRLLPRLRVVTGGGEEPERAAALLRRSVACEVGLAVIVLGLASVLVATQPAVGA
ncbi:MAG: copper resistance CopC/CopD family protein [Thermoleophilaceae bacterium]